MTQIVASDIYPAVRRFLLESGLQKTLRALDKETSLGGDEVETAVAKSKKAGALAGLELTEACQLWLDTRGSGGAAVNANGADGGRTPNGASQDTSKRKKKKQEVEAAAAADTPEPPPAPAEEPEAEPPKKKRKREVEAANEDAEGTEAAGAGAVEGTGAEEQAAAEAAPQRKKKKKGEHEEKKAGVPFQRIDDEKWRKTLTDDRFVDNSHKAKQKFGGSAGDTWADKAAEDLLKVKGKGFRKEMAKKKRASWRGGGEIDQGVNSIKFEDSDEDE